MKSKKIIVSIIVCLVIAVIAVFVVPSSNSYLSELTVSGEKKKSYSFYKSVSISNKLKNVDFRDHLPDGIQKYDESKARYGSPSYTVVIKNDAYRFYRLSSESDVLVTKSNKSDDSQIKEYARINKDSYKTLASSTHYTDYDQLDYWN
ncbi:hypothetical protein [uncultured Catenibacterium sp.]|uniref:hypothetical protein n=1 Tax=uncultured Catenibacterium sp. TaxID=286142 RepID=UPI00261D9CA7|nr:hypothetical protein [uncultured Catenibacterium sp.]